MDQTSYMQKFRAYLQRFQVENVSEIVASYQRKIQDLPQNYQLTPAFFSACKEGFLFYLNQLQNGKLRYFHELKAVVLGIFSIYTWPLASAISIAIMSVSLLLFSFLVTLHLALIFFGVAAIVAGTLDTYIGIATFYSDVGTGLEFAGIGCFFLGVGGIAILLSSHWMKRILYFTVTTINQYAKKYSNGRIEI